MIAIKDLFIYREVLWNFISQELKVKYKGTFLGFFWSLLNPILTMTVTSIVFSSIMRFELKDFVIFVFSGLLPWGFIAMSLDSSVNSIINAEGFMKKVYLPKLIFPIASVCSNFVNMFFSMISLLIILIIMGAKISISFIFLPVSFLIIFVGVLGISLILSTLSVFFRDIRHLIGVITSTFFYLTPIIYPKDYIPEPFAKLINLNPFSYYIDLFRMPIYHLQFPDLNTVLLCLIMSLGFLSIGLIVFLKHEKDFIYRL